MQQLIKKLNLNELTIAYGMSELSQLLSCITWRLNWYKSSRDEVSCYFIRTLQLPSSILRTSSPVSFQTVPSDSMEKRTETVGRIQPHLTAKVVDPHGNIVEVGEPDLTPII